MKITIISQIVNKKTGLGKSVNDFIDFSSPKAEVEQIDITNNELFFNTIYKILKSDSSVFYFTPSGSVFGNIRDSIYLLAMLMKNKKIVCHFHNSSFGNVVESNKFSLMINKYIYPKINKIIVLGEKQKAMFSKLPVREDQFVVIRNGVDENIFSSEESVIEKHKSEVKNIIFFSNMLEEKGYKFVLEIAKKLKNNHKFKFYFSGKFFNENLKKEFEKEITGLKNVEYIAGVYGEEKKKLLSEMNYFVLPSKTEALPISMLEAIVNGCYIIITDVGVVSEVVNTATTSLIKLEDLSPDKIKEILETTASSLSEREYNIEYFKENYSNKNIQEKIYNVVESV